MMAEYQSQGSEGGGGAGFLALAPSVDMGLFAFKYV
jgi:hypothetical protein